MGAPTWTAAPTSQVLDSALAELPDDWCPNDR